MKFQIGLLAVSLLVSCSDVKFTQLSADWDKLLHGEKSVPMEDSIAVLPKPKDSIKTSAIVIPAENLDKRQHLVDFAMQYVGTPYKFACSDPAEGFDCSGFINFVFRHFKYEVPRSSKDFEFFGKETNITSAQPGDLVLFTPTEADTTVNRVGHIGIITHAAGMSSDFVHASSGKANGVTVSSLAEPHYTERFVKVISVIE